MRIVYSIPFTTYDKTLKQLQAAENSDIGIELAVYSWSKKSKEIVHLPSKKIVSFHGPSLPINKENLQKLKDAAKIALSFGLESMTLHPHKVKDADENERIEQQKEALYCIEDIVNSTKCKIAIETFAGQNRILKPNEILYSDIPIVLDTSHLSSLDSLEMILKNKKQICEVHLSEKIGESLHQPIGVYGEMIIENLLKQKWDGILCFEYAGGFEKEMQRDAQYAVNMVSGFYAASENSLYEAEVLFRKAVEIKTNDYLGNYGLGMMLVKSKRYAEAIEFLKKSNEIYPGHFDTLLFLSYAEHALGKHEDAKQTEEELKSLNREAKTFLIDIQS